METNSLQRDIPDITRRNNASTPVSSSQSGPVTSRREQIEAYLLRHYPCQATPFGALTEVGKKFGVTREYVRQIANAMGMGRLYKESRVCLECGGEKAAASQLCQSCYQASRKVTLPCNNCGAPVTRSAAALVRRIAKDITTSTPHGSATYSGDVYCNRRCFGRWLAREHGFTAHPENARVGSKKPVAWSAHDA